MTSIDRWIDQTVQKLKNCGKFEDMVFLKEYQTKAFEVPVKNYLVVATLDGVEKNTLSKLNPGYGKRKDSSAAGFIIYAPGTESGYKLTQRTLELFSEIFSIGSEDEDTPEISLEPIKFDEKADTVYRKITVTFIKYSESSSSGGGEQDYFELFVNGIKIDGLVDVEYTDNCDIFYGESYLTDKPYKKIPINRRHSVLVRKSEAYADDVFYEPDFSARLILDNGIKRFEKCTVTLIKTHLSDGYLVTDIEFTGEIDDSGDGETDG